MARNETLNALFPAHVRQWLGPLITFVAVAALFGIIVMISGIVNLAADIPHPQGWAQLLHYTFTRSVSAHADDVKPPADLGDIPIAKGAMMFNSVCANCHGVPGQGQSLVSLSMRPQPQFLPKVLDEFSPAELFWIVKHGVKYSAMPAFPTQLRDDEVWSMVAFLRALPTMNAATYRTLATPVQAPPDTNVAMPAAAVVAPKPVGFDGDGNGAVPAIGFAGQRLGNNPATNCIGCHGTKDQAPRSGGIPVLGLLNPETIRAALIAYASGDRKSGYMQPIAAQLSVAQIDALADHFGNDRPATAATTPAPHSANLLLRGEQIATTGLASDHVTPCQQCHDVSRATREYYPAIAGQDWRYLRDQLRLYAAGIRHANSPVQPMAAQSHQLKDSDMDAVAAWYASRAPQAPAPVETGPGGPRVPAQPSPNFPAQATGGAIL